MSPLSRRQALLATAAALGGLAACAMPPAAAVARAIEVGPGVFMVQGTGGAADETNLGRIGNSGFMVGRSGVIAIDTGTSYAHGQALLAEIRRVTEQPVRVALITHTRPEFLFGGAAFRERGIPVRMHSRTARLMAARCETCLKTLRQTVGEQAMRGTTMYKADQEFDASHELGLTGRAVRVLYLGHSSGPGDIAVLDPDSGVLFAGGLLDVQRIPDIQDSDLPIWKLALNSLREAAPRIVVPGHGPAAPAATAIHQVANYLSQLEARLRGLLRMGTSLLDVPDAAELPEFERWDQYEIIHRRNASIAFLRFERELMFK